MSAGGAPRKPGEQLGRAQVVQRLDDLPFVPHRPAKSFTSGPTPRPQMAAPGRAAIPYPSRGSRLGTHHQLNPFRRQSFLRGRHRGAIAGRSGGFDVFRPMCPQGGGAPRFHRQDFKMTPPRFGPLCDSAAGLRLQHHRVTDALGHHDRFVGPCGQVRRRVPECQAACEKPSCLAIRAARPLAKAWVAPGSARAALGPRSDGARQAAIACIERDGPHHAI